MHGKLNSYLMNCYMAIRVKQYINYLDKNQLINHVNVTRSRVGLFIACSHK